MLVSYRYLFVRGLHDREEVLHARLSVLDYMRQCGEDILDTRHQWQDGVLNPRCQAGCVPFMEVLSTAQAVVDIVCIFT